MNHLFCDRLTVIVQSEQFGRSQWETGNRCDFICYCLINAINISCNKWTHFPLILCYTFSLSGQMGKLQHLGFDGTTVTNGSDACVGIGLHPIPGLWKLWQSLLLTKKDKYRAPQMQTFQIPFAGVRIRTTYVENWRKNTTAESRWEKARQVAWLIHWEHAGSSQNNIGKIVHCGIQSYADSKGKKIKNK